MGTVEQLSQLAFTPNQAKHLGVNGLDLLLGGWIPATYVNPASPFDVVPLTLTYASSTTATVSYDITGQVRMGTRVKFTQTTVKYGIIKSAAYAAGVTTITFFANDDYSVANAAISDAYFSEELYPEDFPNYFNFTPTYGAQAGSFSATPTTTYARAFVAGKTFDTWVYFDGTLITATADYLNMTTFGSAAPVNAMYLDLVSGQNTPFDGFARTLTNNSDSTVRFYRSDSTDWATATFYVFGHFRGVYA